MDAKAELIKRYADYRKRNTEIKARQQRERAAELLPFLKDVGRAAVAARAVLTVQELSASIGNKNRNFLYSAIRAHEGLTISYGVGTNPPVADRTGEPQAVTALPVTRTWEAHTTDAAGRAWLVVITNNTMGHEDQEHFEISTVDGVVQDIPAEWATALDGDEKALYREIIKHIEQDQE